MKTARDDVSAAGGTPVQVRLAVGWPVVGLRRDISVRCSELRSGASGFFVSVAGISTFHVWASRWLELRSDEIEKKTYAVRVPCSAASCCPTSTPDGLPRSPIALSTSSSAARIDEMRRIQAAKKADVTLRHADGRPCRWDRRRSTTRSTCCPRGCTEKRGPGGRPPASGEDPKEGERGISWRPTRCLASSSSARSSTTRSAGDGRRRGRGTSASRRRAAHLDRDRPTVERSQTAAIWLYDRYAVRCPSPSRALDRGVGGQRRAKHRGLRPAVVRSRLRARQDQRRTIEDAQGCTGDRHDPLAAR